MVCCKLKPKNASYWHDLALSYYYQSKYDNLKSDEFILKSLKCILHAINLNSNNFIYWNLLAILYSLKGNLKSK